MVLIDGHGNCTEVAIGMVDSKGAFVALLDDNDTPIKHFKFSSENGMIQQLSRDNNKLRKQLEAAEKKLDKVSQDLKTYRHIAEQRAERLEALQQRIDSINEACKG